MIIKPQYIYIHDRAVIYRGDTLPTMAARLEYDGGVAVIDLIGSEIRALKGEP